MAIRRLLTLLSLATVAVVPEALVRADDAQVAFQVSLVLQLLGVIIAAIAVAALFSVLGLGVVRLLTRPWRNRASTFVAWSFLRSPREVLPWPARLWHFLLGQVDALPCPTPARFSLNRSLVGIPSLGLGLWLGLPLWQTPVEGWIGIAQRNLATVLVIHGLLLVLAALPWRPLRRFPLQLAVIALFIGAALAGSQPIVARYVDAPAATIALALLLALAIWRGRGGVGRAIRLQKTGVTVLLLAAVLLIGALVAQRVAPGLVLTVASAGIVLAVGAVYLLLQGQAKVSLPVFVSIVGVAAGTWALIVVLSVMGGFASDLRAKMLVANAHALVERPGRAKAFPDAQALVAAARTVPDVAAVSPQVRGDAILSSAFNVNNFVAIRGIELELPDVIRDLQPTVTSGSLGLLQHPAWLASERSLGRKPLESEDDLPAAPELPANPTATQHQGELDSLLQLAPGPSEAAVPQGDAQRDRHAPLLLPSRGQPALTAPREPTLEPSLAPGIPAQPIDDKSNRPSDLPTQALEPQNLRLDHGLSGLPVDEDHNITLSSETADLPLHPGILLGSELARSLQVELGDRVQVVTPDGDIGPTGLRPRVRTFRVAGTFETGLYEADSKVAYVAIGEAVRYFNLAGQANVMELRLHHPEEPDVAMATLRQALRQAGVPDDTELLDWRALNRSLFSALAFERLVIFLVLGLIILVAAFSIVSALTMVILQKHDSIAMLRAMGATAAAVRSAFLQMGAVIGLIGTTAGAILGIGTCVLIAQLGIQLPEAYYVRTLPVRMLPVEIAVVLCAAVLLSLAATAFPATSAARLKPLEGLRHG